MTEKTTTKKWLDQKLETAPPPNRSFDLNFVALARYEGQERIPVGSFVAELYELAKVNRLRAQVEEEQWRQERTSKNLSTTEPELKKALAEERPDLLKALYRFEGKGERKTAFELAVLPFYHNTPILQEVLREFKFQLARHLPLPVLISKPRMVPDYLRDIHKAGLVVTALPHHIFKDSSTKLNIRNPVHKATKQERWFHTMAKWGAELVTLAVVLGMVEWTAIMTVPTFFLIAKSAAIIIAAWHGKWCAQQLANYDMGEMLNRWISCLLDKELGWASWQKLSLPNMAKAIFLTLGNLLVTSLTVMGIWSTVTTLPWVGLTFFGMAAAGLVSAIAGVGSFMAIIGAQRIFWGFSIWDNQISFTKEMGDALPSVDIEKDNLALLKRADQASHPKLLKIAKELSFEERKEFEEDFSAPVKKWLVRFKRPEVSNELSSVAPRLNKVSPSFLEPEPIAYRLRSQSKHG